MRLRGILMFMLQLLGSGVLIMWVARGLFHLNGDVSLLLWFPALLYFSRRYWRWAQTQPFYTEGVKFIEREKLRQIIKKLVRR